MAKRLALRRMFRQLQNRVVHRLLITWIKLNTYLCNFSVMIVPKISYLPHMNRFTRGACCKKIPTIVCNAQSRYLIIDHILPQIKKIKKVNECDITGRLQMFLQKDQTFSKRYWKKKNELCLPDCIYKCGRYDNFMLLSCDKPRWDVRA